MRSEPGKGTTFYVFLPRLEEEASPEIQTTETVPTGNERILFVDDEEVLVDLGKEILEPWDIKLPPKRAALKLCKLSVANPVHLTWS